MYTEILNVMQYVITLYRNVFKEKKKRALDLLHPLILVIV